MSSVSSTNSNPSSESVRKRKRNKCRYCCVKNCHSHEGQPGVKLYRFPGRPWEQERRERWIVAVRRVNENDGSPWMPKQTSRICSKHFVNGAKSTIATHPGYHPTIFPDVYKVRPVKSTDQLSRYGRWKKRDEVKSVATGEGCCTIASTDTTRGSQDTDADTAGHNYSLRPPGLELLCAAAASLQEAQEDKASLTGSIK